METTKKKSPAVAPTTTGANENLGEGVSVKNDTARPIALHVPHRVSGHLGTWGDCQIPHESRRTVFIDAADYIDLADNVRPAHLCPACVDAAVAHAEEERRKKEEQRRRQKANEEAQQRRMREAEMHYQLVDAHRAGDTNTVKKVLDALLAEDDAALAKLGISSWDEVNDDE
ncbi:hypothetical protein [Corynebacterium ureicelerivorans]|uniref:hypothetical protein n=1 Tax=Corynebacterium ureicelerivorans TaxID=401472 RepID=UPI002354FEB3|nr:hypothetical protein [Corynebacterium ureicelerivorans]